MELLPDSGIRGELHSFQEDTDQVLMVMVHVEVQGVPAVVAIWMAAWAAVVPLFWVVAVSR